MLLVHSVPALFFSSAVFMAVTRISVITALRWHWQKAHLAELNKYISEIRLSELQPYDVAFKRGFNEVTLYLKI